MTAVKRNTIKKRMETGYKAIQCSRQCLVRAPTDRCHRRRLLDYQEYKSTIRQVLALNDSFFYVFSKRKGRERAPRAFFFSRENLWSRRSEEMYRECKGYKQKRQIEGKNESASEKNYRVNNNESDNYSDKIRKVVRYRSIKKNGENDRENTWGRRNLQIAMGTVRLGLCELNIIFIIWLIKEIFRQ